MLLNSHAVKSIVLLNQHPSSTGGPTQTIGFYITTVGGNTHNICAVLILIEFFCRNGKAVAESNKAATDC